MSDPTEDPIPLFFTPVPLRRRCDGWTPITQKRFIDSLAAFGCVGEAVRSVRMTRASAYRLRDRPGAESFAAAWDIAIDIGRARIWDLAFERAFEGYTEIRVLRGGSVRIQRGVPAPLMMATLREEPPGNRPRQEQAQPAAAPPEDHIR